jgi:5-methylcytosine-specific restriction endonuclease McrA
MGVRRWKRHSAWVTRSKRWPALRQQALRRDGFKCVQCGARGRLEVDHIKPVRTHPGIAFILSNLQTLCPQHHAAKTRLECGHPPMKPDRAAWLIAIRDLYKPSSEGKKHA